MKTALSLIALLSLGASFLVIADAKSAIHQLLAGVGFLSFVISLSALAVIGAIERAVKRLDQSGAASATSSVRYGE